MLGRAEVWTRLYATCGLRKNFPIEVSPDTVRLGAFVVHHALVCNLNDHFTTRKIALATPVSAMLLRRFGPRRNRVRISLT